MAYDTKADFDAMYRTPAIQRYFGGRPPGEKNVTLNYHHAWMSDGLKLMYEGLLPKLNIASTELVLIVGAGFGWGVEAFAELSGCTTVGIDISAYVQAEKNNTEEAELREAIIAADLDPDTGRGAFLLNAMLEKRGLGVPRCVVIVLDEDMQTNTSRQAIRAALGGWPTVVIMEQIIDETTTEQEITQVGNAANLFAGNQRVIWINQNESAGQWTNETLFNLRGEEVIGPAGDNHFVPTA